MKKVLIADKMHESIEDMFSEIGYQADYVPEIQRGEIIAQLAKYDGLVIRSKTMVDQELIDSGKNLKFVARAGAGLDKINYEYLETKGIKLLNAPEGNRDAVGEHTIGMLLSLLHKINIADKQVRRGEWKRELNRGLELRNKTVGIYGFGFMGSSLAEKLSGFGCEVIGYDKYRNFQSDFAEQVSVQAFFQKTDILSLHIPLTGETKELFDTNYLQNFKNRLIVLNTSRGEILPFQTLVDGLKSGKILGAGLDVLENEKMDKLTPKQQVDFDFLTNSDQVIFTPHVAGWTQESYRKINRVIIEKVKALSKVQV